MIFFKIIVLLIIGSINQRSKILMITFEELSRMQISEETLQKADFIQRLLEKFLKTKAIVIIQLKFTESEKSQNIILDSSKDNLSLSPNGSYVVLEPNCQMFSIFHITKVTVKLW